MTTTVPVTAFDFVPSAFEFGNPWATVCLQDGWPRDVVSMTITCKAGWTDETFPNSLRSWSLTRIASLYDVRADVAIGTVSAAIPRDHTKGMLDRYTVRNSPYVFG